MSVDKLAALVLAGIEKYFKQEEPKSRFAPNSFTTTKKAGELVGPARKQAEYHREREKYYMGELDKAEKLLREKGVTVEAYDPYQGSYQTPINVVSGSITSPTGMLQPRIDQKMLDAIKGHKEKVLEHRNKAILYEKYAAAFSCDKVKVLTLTIEDIHFFRLGVGK